MNYMIRPGIPEDALKVDPEMVIRDCAELFGSTEKEVLSTFRGRGMRGSLNTVEPRQLAMAVIKAKTIKEDDKGKGMPYKQIGSLFKGETGKGKDHSTVIHSINKVADALEVDEDYRDIVDPLLEKYGIKYIDIFKLANR